MSAIFSGSSQTENANIVSITKIFLICETWYHSASLDGITTEIDMFNAILPRIPLESLSPQMRNKIKSTNSERTLPKIIHSFKSARASPGCVVVVVWHVPCLLAVLGETISGRRGNEKIFEGREKYWSIWMDIKGMREKWSGIRSIPARWEDIWGKKEILINMKGYE